MKSRTVGDQMRLPFAGFLYFFSGLQQNSGQDIRCIGEIEYRSNHKIFQ